MPEFQIPDRSSEKVKAIKKNNILMVILIICLLIGIVWTVLEFKNISEEGVACISQPFVWGADKMVKGLEGEGHMDCMCSIYNDVGFQSQYSFNENSENPIKEQQNINRNFNNLFGNRN